MAQVFGSSAKSRRRKDRKKVEVKRKEFRFNGKTVEELQKLSLEELLPLLTARVRRSLKRGLTKEQNKLLEDVRKAQEGDSIKTHCRSMVILPEFIGLSIQIYNGKEFERVSIQPQMIGHFLGEFAITRKRVKHTGPGVGATKSSKFMPLK